MNSLPINIADLIVFAVLVVSAILAFARGFVHEVLSVAGWIGAGFASIYGFPYLRPYARNLIPVDTVADIAAGSVIFIFAMVVLSLLSKAISSSVKASALNALDRALGFLFGLLRGAVVICLIYIALDWIYGPSAQAGSRNPQLGETQEARKKGGKPKWLLAAKSLPLVKAGADILISMVPDNTISTKAGKIGGEAEKTLRDMLTKTPMNPTIKPLEGYKKTIRKGLDKAIESIQ